MHTEHNIEVEPLKSQASINEPNIPFTKLLKFASGGDKLLMVLGCFAAFANGAAFPLFSLIFGEMTDSFGPDSTDDDVIASAGMNAMYDYIDIIFF